MISEIESAIKGVAENTSNARIRARLKYFVICDKDLHCLANIGCWSAE